MWKTTTIIFMFNKLEKIMKNNYNVHLTASIVQKETSSAICTFCLTCQETHLTHKSSLLITNTLKIDYTTINIVMFEISRKISNLRIIL